MDYREEREVEEKGKREKKTKIRSSKGSLCMPRLKGTKASPVALLQRLREVLFRLIMLSAMSKDSETRNSCSARDVAVRRHCPSDSHYSEAVADCIEFFKQSATASAAAEEAGGSKEGGGSDDRYNNVELPAAESPAL